VIAFDQAVEGLADLLSVPVAMSTGNFGSANSAVRTQQGSIVVVGWGGRVALVR
jgi:hypothetical protein